MRLKIGNLIKILIIIFAATLLMYLSELMHNIIKSFFFDLISVVLNILVYGIAFFQIAESILNFADYGVTYKINILYTKSLDNSREKFQHYLQVKKEDIPCHILGQLMVLFYEDENIFCTLLSELNRQYQVNTLMPPIVSYIFLKNCNNSNIVEFFFREPTFKSECEQLSQSITSEFVDKLSASAEVIITIDNFNDVLIGLIHACLPQNHVPKNTIIYILRNILSWVNNEISENNINDHQNTVSLFLILLPILQRKICDMNIHNEYLDKQISMLQKSKWKHLVINNVCREIVEYCQNDSNVNIKPSQCARNASLLSVYFENISFTWKMRLYFAIRRCNEKLFLKYNSFTDDEVLSLLISLTSFGTICDTGDVIERTASMMFLCATAPFSHLMK